MSTETSPKFVPKIVAFLCNWCSYAGADLAGVSRFQYPTPIRIIRVMCSGRIDPYLIIESFRLGADGVFIGGCHLGDCHYLEGNYNAIRKISLTKKLLDHAGFDPERLRLEWISAAEGERFAKTVTGFIEHITGLGPSPLGQEGSEKLRMYLKAATESALDSPLRTLVGREYKLTEKSNVYGEKIAKERMEQLVDEMVDLEMNKHLILDLIDSQPRSVKELAKVIELKPSRVLKYIISLRQENKVASAGHEGMSPLYIAVKAGGD